MHALPFDSVRDRLPTNATEDDWVLLRPNLARIADFAEWYAVLHGDIDAPNLSHDERQVVKDAAAAAEKLDWTSEPWRDLTNEVKASSGKKGRELFHPLRLALTGRASGPRWRASSSPWARTAPSAASRPRPSARRNCPTITQK